jgi:hypothetical protein
MKINVLIIFYFFKMNIQLVTSLRLSINMIIDFHFKYINVFVVFGTPLVMKCMFENLWKIRL